MRKLLFATIFAFISTQVSGIVDWDEFKRGDVNSDTIVDITDIVALNNHLFLGTFDPTCFDACDANDDGVVDNTDPIYILDYLFNDGPSIPDPFQYCGDDPSSDNLGCVDGGCP